LWVEREPREAPEIGPPVWEGGAADIRPRDSRSPTLKETTMLSISSLRVLTLTAAACAAFAAGSAASAADRSEKDWQFRGAGKEVKSGTAYTMYNVTDKEAVRYGERKWGINLVWDKKATLNNIKLVGQGNASGPIKYGDKVAIHVEKGGYLKYQKRDYGINLVWSTPPVYEFVVTGGTKGTVVPTNATVGLYNTVEKDFLINAERPVGINLRWYKDRDKGGSFTTVVKDIGKKLVKEGLKELADEFIK
jgi:hypothetical protein